MKWIIAIIGGVISAVTCLIPLLVTDGNYTDNQIVLSASGLTMGSGLLALSYGLSKQKYWYILFPISSLLLFYSFCYLYDYYLDFNNNFKSIHFVFVLFCGTIITLLICIFFKLRQR